MQRLGLATDGAQMPSEGSALGGSGMPKAGSMAHMLAQALHSNDKSLLEQCLTNTNETVVRKTVMRSVQAIGSAGSTNEAICV